MRRGESLGAGLLVLFAVSGCLGQDARLERKVEDQIGASGAEVDVSVDDRVVTLRGVVSSERERNRIEGAAIAVEGVRWVENDLVIPLPPVLAGAGVAAEDSLALLVERRLASAGFPEVIVAEEDGIVTLRGAVERHRRDEVMKVAREASPRVRAVHERLFFR